MSEMGAGAQGGSAGAGEQAKEKAQQVAGQAQEKAQEAAGQAKSRIAVEVDSRSTQAGQQLRSTAGDVRTVAEELRKQGKDKPAQLAERAAERAERLGGYLHESDGERILRDVEDFGRRQPWAVAAGGLAAGFAASRLLKASSSRRYQASFRAGASYRPSPAGQAPAWASEAGGAATPAPALESGAAGSMVGASGETPHTAPEGSRRLPDPGAA